MADKKNKFIEEIGFPQQLSKTSSVKFTLQNGPVKDVGENGCQIDDIISWVRDLLEDFNEKVSCYETERAIERLENALLWLTVRKKNREARKVEGTNKK